MFRFCLLSLLPLGLAAQGEPVFRAESTLVTVPVLVTDSRGAPVGDLRADEFRLFDNGEPRAISHVWFERELPLVIAIVVDISASQHAFLREHRAAVDAFLAGLLRPGDRAFVVAVNRSVVLESEFIRRQAGLGQVVLPPGGQPLGISCTTLTGRSLCGDTALWDAIYSVTRSELARFAGARALLVLSDGNDTGSIHGFDQALAEVRRVGALVYAIRYPDRLTHIAGEQLSRLAQDTGGAEFSPPAGDYSATLDRIQLDLRSHYVLGMTPGSGIGPRHDLRVEVTRPNLTVRFRRQYLVPE